MSMPSEHRRAPTFDPAPAGPSRVVRARRPWRRCAWWVLGILAVGLRLATWPWRHAARPVGRVILFEPFGMGDVLSLQPLVRVLSSAGRPVVVAAQDRWRPLIPEACVAQWIDPGVPWRGGGLSSVAGLQRPWIGNLWRGLRALHRVARGSVGFDPRGDVRSVILLTLLGCRHVLTFDRYYVAADYRMFPGAAVRLRASRNEPRWKVNLAFLEAGRPTGCISGPVDPPGVAFLGGGPDAESAGCLALIPVSPWRGKRWPASHWQALIGALPLRGWHPVALCGPGETAETAAEIGGMAPVRECPTLEAWVRALRSATAVVSVNTGPMHLADALGKRLLVLNGSSQVPLWSPSNPRARVLHHQDRFVCAPCHEVGDVSDCASACMAAITPAEVLEALETVPPPAGPPVPPRRGTQPVDENTHACVAGDHRKTG